MALVNLFQKISAQKGANRMVLNTAIIYTQRLSAAVLSLITTPIILNALGVEDYGIYALTVGLVGMMAFINWSLTSATQRYIAHSIGAGDINKLIRVFTSSFLIHLVYGLILLLVIFFFSGIIVDKFLSIPALRIDTAKVVIRFVSIITFINIVTVPFTGLFMAYENFLYLSLIGIVESVLKLCIAISLLFIDFDRLIAYSGFLLAISIVLVILNVVFSKKIYPEVKINFHNFDKKLISEMMGFMGWNLLGAAAIMSRNQGVAVLLNLFFGVIANAAYGIAMQVNAAISILSQGIIGSISPQIVKSAGAGDTDKMIYLMQSMSKFAVISVSIVAVPFLIEAPFILRLWLRNVPDGAILFSRLIIAFSLIMLLSAGMNNVFNAMGKVKLYNIYISLILILNLPLAYLLFKLGFKNYTIILTGMLLEVISLFVRLYLLNKYVKLSLLKFINDLIFKIISPILFTTGIVLLVKQINSNDYIQLFLTFFLFLIIFPFIVYRLSLDEKQKVFVMEIISKVILFVKNLKIQV